MADDQLYSGGELRDAAAGETFTTYSPGTGQAIAEVAKAGGQVEDHLAAWVHVARERGISWAKVGDALGITRQSAWERFVKRG